MSHSVQFKALHTPLMSYSMTHLYDEGIYQLPHQIEYQGRSKNPEESWRRLGCEICLPGSPKHAPPGVPNHLWHWCIPMSK